MRNPTTWNSRSSLTRAGADPGSLISPWRRFSRSVNEAITRVAAPLRPIVIQRRPRVDVAILRARASVRPADCRATIVSLETSVSSEPRVALLKA